MPRLPRVLARTIGLLAIALWLGIQDVGANELTTLREAIDRGDWAGADAALAALAGKPVTDRVDLDFLSGMMWLARGDLDAAAAAFRRVVDARPDLPRPRLELARVLYLRGDDDAARAHFTRVLAGNVPSEVADNVRTFLADIERRNAWSIDLSLAPVADDNLNGGTYHETIDLGGLSFNVNPDARAVAGHGLVAALSGRRLLPLAGAWRHELAVGWQHKNYNRHAFDEDYARLAYGLRRIAGGRRQLDWGASGFVTDRRVGHRPFSDSRGVRVDARGTVGPATSLGAALERQWLDYPGTPDRDGPLTWAAVSGQRWLDTATSLVASLDRLREHARSPAFRLTTYGLNLALYHDYARAITVGLTGRLATTRYDQEFALFGERRRDDDRSLGLYLAKKDLALFGLHPSLSVSREWRNSSIDFFSYRRNRYLLAFERRL